MDGFFLDGWSLAEVPIRVTLTGEALHVHDASGRELRVWSLAGLHVDAMQEGRAAHLTHDASPQEQLVLHDPELVRRVSVLAGRVTALPGGDHKLLYGLVCLLAVLLLMGGFYVSVPPVARFVARWVPLEHERALGAELELVLDLDRCVSPNAEAVLRELLRALGGDGREVRVLSMAAPNAFALPGGIVLVTRGLLREAESGDEIAGVLAHELEHVAQRHVLAGALRSALLTALWSVTVGDYSGLLVVDPSTAYEIATLEFSREDEQAADRGAVTRLHRAGLSHRGLISFLESVQERYGEGGPAWLSTHPSAEVRVRTLEGMRDLDAPRASLREHELETLRAACAEQ